MLLRVLGLLLLLLLLSRLVRSWSPGGIDTIESQTSVDALGLGDHSTPLGEVVCEAVEATLGKLFTTELACLRITDIMASVRRMRTE